MPPSTFVEIPTEEHAEMLAARRRARYGSFLSLHILLWCAAGRAPTAMAAVLFGSRSSVVPHRAIRSGGLPRMGHDDERPLVPPVRRPTLLATRRSLVALLKAPPGRLGGAGRAGAVPRWL